MHFNTMATNNSNYEIKNSWSLLSFARSHGKMQVGTFKSVDQEGNSTTFKSCIFTDEDDNRTFVGFSSNLGVLSPKEIAERKNDLQVVQLVDSQANKTLFSLCRKGENNWEDVDL